jgi:two-component system response regulator LytT
MDIENLDNLNVLLVDDEPIIAYSMQSMLEAMGIQHFEIVHSKEDAISKIETGQIKLAILDINLGEGEEGIALASLCAQKDIPFFYVTSYNDLETLNKAIKTAPGAYVEKPFMVSNLYAALNLTLQRFNNKAKTYFPFKHNGELIRLKFSDIIYIKAEDIYLHIVTKDKTYLHRSSLKKMLSVLPNNQFKNSHRAYIVNLQQVSHVTPETVELEGASIPLSRTYKQELKRSFFNNIF